MTLIGAAVQAPAGGQSWRVALGVDGVVTDPLRAPDVQVPHRADLVAAAAAAAGALLAAAAVRDARWTLRAALGYVCAASAAGHADHTAWPATT